MLKSHCDYGYLGLELRYLSFCPNLANVSMIGSPIAALTIAKLFSPDFLVGQFSMTNQTTSPRSIVRVVHSDDAILLKELVADGLLDEDELLENEPVTRPFTAMGLRLQNHPVHTLPTTLISIQATNFKRTSTKCAREIDFDLTQGNALQGRRGLMNRFKGHKQKSGRRAKSTRKSKTNSETCETELTTNIYDLITTKNQHQFQVNLQKRNMKLASKFKKTSKLFKALSSGIKRKNIRTFNPGTVNPNSKA